MIGLERAVTVSEPVSRFRQAIFRLGVPALLALLTWQFRQQLGAWGKELEAHGWSGAANQAARLVHAAEWLFITWFFLRLMDALFWDWWVPRRWGRPAPGLLRQMTRLSLFLLSMLAMTNRVFSVPISGLWATSGVVSIVLGVALKEIILDAFMGLSINLDQPYQIGDWLKIHGKGENTMGWVREINWRTTRLQTDDNNWIIIPNSVMGQSVITNYSQPSELGRWELEFTFDPSIPPERIIRVLKAGALSIASPHGVRADPPPDVILDRVSSGGYVYRLRYHHSLQDMSRGGARNQVMAGVAKHLFNAGIHPSREIQEVLLLGSVEHTDAGTGLHTRLLLISRVELFEGATGTELKRFAEMMIPRFFKAGDIVIRQGEPGESMFVVGEGAMEARLVNDKHPEGLVLGKIQPGQFFGEMSVLTGEPRTASIISALDSLVFEIRREAFVEIAGQNPKFLELVSQTIARRKAAMESSLNAQEKTEKAQSMSDELLGKMKNFLSKWLG
ncbi:MAG: hypothetical protein GMKNLPBB_00125 [Myxococcota bacterium]|nr:hypothetical protein [Myxococcota bacterium]